jgi:hypothetical protein
MFINNLETGLKREKDAEMRSILKSAKHVLKSQFFIADIAQ